MMERQEFLDAIDGLHAYDIGDIDSGIHNELLRERIKALLKAQSKLTLSWLNLYIVRLLNSGQGYTLKDIKELICWLEDEMDCMV